jgi:hypothetical protein
MVFSERSEFTQVFVFDPLNQPLPMRAILQLCLIAAAALCNEYLLVAMPVRPLIAWPHQADSLPPGDSIVHQKIQAIEVGLQKIEKLIELNSASEENIHTKNKKIRIGLSLGYRWLTANSSAQNVSASVSPLDSTLRLSQNDKTAYLFSTSVIFEFHSIKNKNNTDYFGQGEILEKRNRYNTSGANKAYPSSRKNIKGQNTPGKFLRNAGQHICLMSNINILDFSSGQKELAFNKSIEGGLGIGYRLNENMYLAINWEHIQSWQLYDDIKKHEGEKLVLYGTPLINSNQLDLDNEDLFYKKNFNGWSFKIIFCL